MSLNVDQVFKKDGPLAKYLPNYLPRPGQVALAKAVESSLRDTLHLLAEGPTGCHAAGQEILLYDGSVKLVENVVVGDQLMGPDSCPRVVLSLARGVDEMVKVTPVKGDPWVVNKGHILTLIRTGDGEGRRKDCKDGTVLDVSVKDYLGWSATQKHLYKLMRVGVTFEGATSRGRLPPYYLGMLLGDGCLTQTTISVAKPDAEIANACDELAVHYGATIRRSVSSSGCPTYNFKGGYRSLVPELRKMGLFGPTSHTKFVPQAYKVGSHYERLELLAGLLDTDGYYGNDDNYYELSSASLQLANDTAFVARSLGFAAYVSSSEKHCQTGGGGLYHRVTISGDVALIPCRVGRKKARGRTQIKSVLRTGFKLELLPDSAPYFGFSLDGDGRYLLGDFTVTHNTGKSLAYGIPAAIHALESGESVVIATANIALQEQLAKKDLPLIKNVMKDLGVGDLVFFSRKGLGNYVCLHKLEELTKDASASWAVALRSWVTENETGDREELPVDYHEKWFEVAANNDECHHSKCRFFKECFAFRSRTGNKQTGCIVVTNYHLLYADCVVREATGGTRSLLPDYTVTIMDEAHEAIDIARGFQGISLSMPNIGRLNKRFKKLVKFPDGLKDRKIQANDALDRLMLEGREFFDEVLKFHYKNGGGRVFHAPLGFGQGLLQALVDCSKIASACAGLLGGSEEAAMLSKLADLFIKRAWELKSICYGYADDPPCLFPEAEGKVTKRQAKLLELLNCKLGELEEEAVHFTEYEGRGQHVVLCKKVIQVQDFIRQNFLDNTVLIATSATLSTRGNFDFIANEMGLERDEYSSLIAPSPFDAKKMLVVVPKGFPSPKSRDQHIFSMVRGISRVVQELGGRSMALFTSYDSLKATSAYLEKNLKGVQLLVQGEMPRGKIVERLKEDERSVILATASFWQGIDIPGRALSCLFIEKFPFTPPTDPVLCYMEEKLAKKRGSAFVQYSIPKAVIALKQGVGRLIRKESDYGAVVLFDPRLETENYGSHFESAFPEDHYRTDNLSDVVQFIRDYDEGKSL